MKKTKSTFAIVIVALLICVAFFFMGRMTRTSGNNQKMSAIVLENRLAEVSELASITYSYTNMAEFENSKDFYGMTLPFTTKGFILTYDGEIKAGIDLSEAQVNMNGKEVTITLPKAKVLSHEINEDSIEVFDETTSIFNSFKIEDYQAFCSDQKKEMEAKAEKKGLLKEAHTKAIKSIKTLISQVLTGDYELTVK